MTEVPLLTLHELADGVFVWLQPGGESGVSNAGVVVDDDGITVIDTLMVRSQWEPFVGGGRTSSAGRSAASLLTHAHIDHVGGTRGFPNAAVYGSPQTSELLDGAMPLDAYKAFMPAFDEEFDELAELGTRPVTHLVTDGAFLTPRIEVMPADGSHLRRPHGAGRRCRRVVRRRPVLLRRDTARVPGRPRDVGRHARRRSRSSRRGSFPATARSAASRKCASSRRICGTASQGRSHPARGTPGPSANRATRSTSSGPQLLAAGRDEMPPAMLTALGFG